MGDARMHVLVWAEGVDAQELLRRPLVRVRVCAHDGAIAIGAVESR